MARNTYRSIANLGTIPVPVATESYCPVPQDRLWNMAMSTFERSGYTVRKENHMVHRKRPVFVSTIEIHAPWMADQDSSTFTVGMMNSYDRTMSARIIFGKTIFVCTNGLIFADHVLRTKHTTHVWDRLPGMVETAVNVFRAEAKDHEDRDQLMLDFTTSDTDLAKFTVEIARRGILPKAKMLDFYEESVKPSFDYQTNALCLWNLQAAYTHLAKEMNPVERPSRVMAFDRTLSEYYAIAN